MIPIVKDFIDVGDDFDSIPEMQQEKNLIEKEWTKRVRADACAGKQAVGCLLCFMQDKNASKTQHKPFNGKYENYCHSRLVEVKAETGLNRGNGLTENHGIVLEYHCGNHEKFVLGSKPKAGNNSIILYFNDDVGFDMPASVKAGKIVFKEIVFKEAKK